MSDSILTKTCTKCGVTKPLSGFSKHRSTRDGFDTQCKACKSAYNREWAKRHAVRLKERRREYYIENREKILEYSQMHKGIKNILTRRGFPLPAAGWKFCTDCRYMLPLEEFHNDRSSSDGHTYRCKECARAAALASHYADHEGRLERSRAYYDANKERMKAWQLEYSRRFRQKYSLIKRSYAARERAADGLPFTHRDILAVYKAQRGRCYYCGVALRKVFELDHVVPISKGGGNEPGNVVCACEWCNANKRALDVEEFMRLHFTSTGCSAARLSVVQHRLHSHRP